MTDPLYASIQRRLDNAERRIAGLQRLEEEHTHVLDRLTTAIEVMAQVQVDQQRLADTQTQILNDHGRLLTEQSGLLGDLVRLVGSIDDRLGNVEQLLRERGHQNGTSPT